MTPSGHCEQASDHPSNPRRHMILLGSREDALEFLPAFSADERLEFDSERISLVCERTRVDVNIVAETHGGGPDRLPALMLLELAFEGRTEYEADAFVQCYRRRARRPSYCH